MKLQHKLGGIVGAMLITSAFAASTLPSLSSARTVHCVRVSSEPQARVLPGASGGFGDVRFTVQWNPNFQSYELLWSNRGEHPIRVRFVAQPRTRGAVTGERRLAAGEREAPPGQSVMPADGRVCVELSAETWRK